MIFILQSGIVYSLLDCSQNVAKRNPKKNSVIMGQLQKELRKKTGVFQYFIEESLIEIFDLLKVCLRCSEIFFRRMSL